MLILPEDDANEEEYGRQACRRKVEAVDKYKQADDELAWTIDCKFFSDSREFSLIRKRPHLHRYMSVSGEKKYP